MALTIKLVNNEFFLDQVSVGPIDFEKSLRLSKRRRGDSDEDGMTVVALSGGPICLLTQPLRNPLPSVSVAVSSVEQDGFVYYRQCRMWCRFFDGWEPVNIIRYLTLVALRQLKTYRYATSEYQLKAMGQYPELTVRKGFYLVARQCNDYPSRAWCFFYGSTWDESGHGWSPLHAAVSAGDEDEVRSNLKFIYNYSESEVHETAFSMAIRLRRWAIADIILAADYQVMLLNNFTKTQWMRYPIVEAMLSNDEDAMMYFSKKALITQCLYALRDYIPLMPLWVLKNIGQHSSVRSFDVVDAYDAFRLRICGLNAVWNDPQYRFLPSTPDNRSLQQLCGACILTNKISTDKLPKELAEWILMDK